MVTVPRGRLDALLEWLAGASEGVNQSRKEVENLRTGPTSLGPAAWHARRLTPTPHLIVTARMAIFHWQRWSALRLTSGHSRFVLAVLHPDEALSLTTIAQRAGKELGSAREGATSQRAAERSRDATIEEIRRQDPALAAHFDRTLCVEGGCLIYRPTGIVWTIERVAPPERVAAPEI